MHRIDLDAFLDEVRPSALDAGVPVHLYADWTANLEPDSRVITLSSSQPEHTRTVGDYVDALVSETRIARGRSLVAHHADLLARIGDRYGVPASVLTAIWGIESDYGTQTGTHEVLRSLATLAAMGGRRSAFWRGQFLAALSILNEGDVEPNELVGSWAAAMGHMQFMPTTFLEHAVDFDEDGRRDIWQSIADALASAANYLAARGWTRDKPWGWEVRIPAQFDYMLVSEDRPRPLDFWIESGVSAPRSQDVSRECPCMLVLPAGARGPSFLTTANFTSILTYNNATAYALAVGHLADRIAGGAPLVTKWPGDDPLSGAERQELQQLLVELGYDTGGVDGIIGRASRRAIQMYQQRCKLVPDGYPDRVVLEELRRTR